VIGGLKRRWRRRAALRGVRTDAGVVIYGDPRNLHIARGVILQAHVVIHAGGMSWCEGAGHVEIGAASVISPGCVIYGAGPGGVRIGRSFDCGPHVGIFSSRTRPGGDGHLFARVVIGDRVTVYAGAVISPGVTIGDGAVIAANAVVTRDVPPGSFVGGLPARELLGSRPE
jgi:acetyltransferase-like isoleucine patch superfamily enzyme